MATAILAGVLAVPGVSAAADSRASSAHSGDYLALIGFGSHAEIDDVSSSSGSFEVRNDTDGTGGIGLALGYNWAKKGLPIRSEIEYHYRFRFDFDGRLSGDGYETNLASHMFLANLYYDYGISKTWSVYAGGGIGLGLHEAETDHDVNLNGSPINRTDYHSNFVWNLAVGVVWKAWENWDIDARYRYFDLGEVESGPHSASGITITADSYVSHDFLFAVVYRF